MCATEPNIEGQSARPATSLRAQQKEAAWNNAYMLQLLAG